MNPPMLDPLDLSRGRELQLELSRCPEPERELKLKGRSFDVRELLRDETLQRTVGTMRELRLAREHELARGHEIERRGIGPLREFQRNPQYGRDREAADAAWARHAAEKGLAMEQIRDELLKERQQVRQPGHERELERITRLAERQAAGRRLRAASFSGTGAARTRRRTAAGRRRYSRTASGPGAAH